MAEFEWVSLVIGLSAGSCITTLVILFFAVSRGNRRERSVVVVAVGRSEDRPVDIRAPAESEIEDVERVDSPTLTHRRLT